MVNMTFLHAQDLPWVGPPTATPKQPPGLTSSQSCVSLCKKSADFTFLSFLAPVWAHFHGQYYIFACSGPSLGWSSHSNSKATPRAQIVSTATAKQQPGLKSSQNCASLRMHSADFTVIVNSSPHLAPFS